MPKISNKTYKQKMISDLDMYIVKFLEHLESLHFSRSVIQKYNSHLRKYQYFCIQNNISDFFSTDTFSKFFESICNFSTYSFKFSSKVLTKFKDFNLLGFFKIVYASNCECLKSTAFKQCLSSFNSFLIQSQITTSTTNAQYNIVKRFLIYLEKYQILSLDNLSFNIVYEYVNSSNFAHATKCNYAKVLKKFLNFTFQNNITSFSGKDIFPRIRVNYRNRILSFYSIEEISQLLASVNTDTPIGKRDYLIILLASTLGLRSGDISNLTLKNIDLEKKFIKIIQHKTKKELIQPFSEEVLLALLDYLKNSKPKCNSNKILITTVPPFRPLTTSAIHKIITKYFKIANINISNRKHGAHSLRHSLANNMLINNVSLQDISASLGHEYLSTSVMYTNIDLKHLKLISLEVPSYVVK